MWWTVAIVGSYARDPAARGPAAEVQRLPVTLVAAPVTAPVHVVVPVVIPPDRLDAELVARRAVAVVASDGEPLPFEIEGWGDPLGTTLWVDPGPVSPGVDRTVWVEWRTSGGDHPDAVPLVWPAPWVGVWHLDGCGARCPSSVPGAAEAELSGALAEDGRFGRGRRLDGAGSVRIPLGDAADADRVVVYAWSWSDDALPGRTLANLDAVGVVRCADPAAFRFGRTGQTMCSVPAALDVGAWQLLAVEVDGRRGGATFRPWLDGQPLFPLALDEPLGWAGDAAVSFGPRHGVAVEGPGAGALAFVGRVDEVRVAAEALPASVIRAEHHFATGGVVLGEPPPPPDTGDPGAPGAGDRSSSRLVAGRCDASGGSGWGLAWLAALGGLRRRRWAAAALASAASSAAWSAPPKPADEVRLPVTLDARTIPAPVHVPVPIVIPPGTGLEVPPNEATSVAVLDEADQPLPFEVEGWGDPQGTTLWVDPGPIGVGEVRTVWVVWRADGSEHPANRPLVWPDVWAAVWHFGACVDGDVCWPEVGGGELEVDGAQIAGRFGRGWQIGDGDRLRLDLASPAAPLVAYAWMRSDDGDLGQTLLNADQAKVVRCPGGLRLGAGAIVSGRCLPIDVAVGAWQLVTVEVTLVGPRMVFGATVDAQAVETDELGVIVSDTPRLEIGPAANGSERRFVGEVDELRIAYEPVPRETRIAEFRLAEGVTVGEPGGEPVDPEPLDSASDTGSPGLSGRAGGVWRRARAGRCDVAGWGGGWVVMVATLAAGRRRRCCG